MFYSISDSIVELFRNPVLWVDEMQITSDTIQINILKQKIESMNFYPDPIIISEVDSLHYNQIKGKNMTAWFNKNKLNKLDIFGNGQSLFLIEDDKTKEKIGINKAICTDISILMNEGKLSTIHYKTIPTSTTIPYQDVIESDKLQIHAKTVGDYFIKSLKKIKLKYPKYISEIRGRGLFLGIDLINIKTHIPNAKLANYIINKITTTTTTPITNFL